MPDRKKYEEWFLRKISYDKLQAGLEEVRKFRPPVTVRNYQITDDEDEEKQSVSEAVNREDILKQIRVKPPEQLPK